MSLVNKFFMFNWGRLVNDLNEFTPPIYEDYFFKGQFLSFDVDKKLYTIQYENETKKRKINLNEITQYIILKKSNIYQYEKKGCERAILKLYSKWLKKEKPNRYTKTYESFDKQRQREIFMKQCVSHDDNQSKLDILFLETENCKVIEILKTKFGGNRLKPCNICPTVCHEIQLNHPDVEVYCGNIKIIANQRPFLAIWYDMEETMNNFKLPLSLRTEFLMINLATRPFPVKVMERKLNTLFEKNGGKDIEVSAYRGKSKRKNMVFGYASFSKSTGYHRSFFTCLKQTIKKYLHKLYR